MSQDPVEITGCPTPRIAARLLAITDTGRDVKDAVKADIQRGDELWPGQLSTNERDVFPRVLDQLSRRPD